MEWWNSLSAVNQWFYVAAIFFSVFFVWQLIAALLGLGDDTDAADAGAQGADPDVDTHEAGHDVAHDLEQNAVHDSSHTVSAFKLLSVRSLIAFATLFSWAGSLYLQGGTPLAQALVYAILWGAAAMVAVSGVFSLLHKMTETGNQRIATALGTEGKVYISIPASGEGEVRVSISGIVTVARARAAGGAPIEAGTPVRVVRVLGPNTLEVKPIDVSTGNS